MNSDPKKTLRAACATLWALLFALTGAMGASGYAFDEIVPDVRQGVALSGGGSACPVRAHQLSSTGSVTMRWSTALSATPTTIFTQDQTANGRLNEIEQVIAQSIDAWTDVDGTTLTPASLAPLNRVAAANACGSDGVNSICFDQADGAFAPGVLAFTRVITADTIGAQVGSGASATQIGQILDADIYFDPSDSSITFATPAALAANPRAYDLESLLTHEFGHALGFSHSAIWGAMMYPYAPAPGTFNGARPTSQKPDALLADDDRTGLRALYPAFSDNAHVGSIAGRILPANPLSLPASPPGITGIFGAHIVAVDTASGSVVAGTIGGWSCVDAGPVQFDGSYLIERLPVGHSYNVYTEPLNGVVSPAQIAPAIVSLCRNSTTDAGWPPLQACTVPAVNIGFTTRTRPGT
jgi:matrixin